MSSSSAFCRSILTLKGGKTMAYHEWDRRSSEQRQQKDVTFGEYKGHPIISIPTDKGKPFTFGVTKAKAVLDHIDQIREFVSQRT